MVLNLFYTGNRSQVICLNQPNIRSEIWRRSLSYLAIPSLTSESLKAFKSESTIDCWMNVKEHLETGAISEVLSDCNGIRTYNHLVRKRTLNYLMKLTEWVRIPLASNPQNSAAVTDVNYSITHFRSDVPREHHSEDGSMNPVRLKPAIFHSPSPLIMGKE